jgi:hypothetical protein
MLWPKNASGPSASERTTPKIASASSGMVSMHGSARRSWRPGYCTAQTSMAGDNWAETGKKKLAEPPASARHCPECYCPGRCQQRRLDWPDDPAAALHRLASLQRQIQDRLPRAVADARREGCSRAEIGDLLGVTCDEGLRAQLPAPGRMRGRQLDLRARRPADFQAAAKAGAFRADALAALAEGTFQRRRRSRGAPDPRPRDRDQALAAGRVPPAISSSSAARPATRRHGVLLLLRTRRHAAHDDPAGRHRRAGASRPSEAFSSPKA